MKTLDLKLNEEGAKKISEMMRATGFSLQDVMNSAVELIKAEIEFRKAGSFIASVDEKNETYKPIVLQYMTKKTYDLIDQ